MATIFTDKYLPELLEKQQAPGLSLYMPTHRTHPDSEQDPIRYRNLVKQLKELAQGTYEEVATAPLFAQFDALATDKDFWNHALEGLAILATPKLFRVYRLQRPVAELAIVADSLHTKPLQKYVQSADRYEVLVLGLNGVQLYEGNRYHIDPVELNAEVPKTMQEALGEELTDDHFNTAFATGNGSNKAANQSTGNVVHGYMDKSEEAQKDAERFFRAVDRAILEHYSKPSGLPLILASLPEHQNLFRSVSHNKQLLPEGIKGNAASLDLDELRNRAWQLFEPEYDKRLDEAVAGYEANVAQGLGSDLIEQVAKEAIAGRVATLLVEENRIIPGSIDAKSADVVYKQGGDAGVDDLLDDLADLVRSYGGQSMVIPKGKMPSQTGVAAIYRY
ncbi:hypothetical protein [Olivibacter sitiensis]|uniref:baeRF3 domain-containing protein n=1 Tax=Olivibacter sitiensis TaxID=376470 RepID=UPI000407F5DD|nr:hypothetical protein [Olivibacter sitiensis]